MLRLRAVEQVEAGAHPEEVAQALGLHRKTVYGWLAKYRKGGKDALTARPVPGRPPKLSDAQLSRLHVLLTRDDPRQLSFDFALWTREMVREVISREFGVRLSVVSVGRLLRRLGFSPQRPLHRAYQQNQEARQLWTTNVFRTLREQAATEGATIYFAAETGTRTDHHTENPWAPVDLTSMVKADGHRYSVTMISAITAKGALRFAVYNGNTSAELFIDFCRRLLHDTNGPAYLVVDGHPAHCAAATKDFIASTDGMLRLVVLPGYIPELNPDEWVRQD